MKPKLEQGSIIQIIPLGETDPLAGCLMIVSEVKKWGVQAYMAMPTGGVAWFRVEDGHFYLTGALAEYLVDDPPDEADIPTHVMDS